MKIVNRKWLKVWPIVIGVAVTLALVLALVPVGLRFNADGLLSINIKTTSANPDGWLSGWSYRVGINISEDGGGAKSNYAIPLDVYYGPPKIEQDGSTFWYSLAPGMYYEGTHKRAYYAYYTSDYCVKLQYFDEETLTLSDAVTLWSTWGYGSSDVLGDHHAAPTAIVLQHQTGGNAVHNGKILVAASEHSSPTAGKGRLETRRSTYAEFNNGGQEDTSFDSAVQVRSTDAAYSHLIELSNGTIFLFSRLSSQGDNSAATTYAWTSTDAGSSWTTYNNGNALWDAPGGTDDCYYFHACPNNDDTGIHCMISRTAYDDPEPGITRYQDIYYLFYKNSDGKWYKADGTTEFTLGNSHASMDLVYASDDTQDAEDWTWAWDIQDDGTGNPYLIFVNDVDRSSDSGGNCDVLRANYSGGSWNVETVLADGTGHSSNYPHGACLDPLDMDVVYVTPPLGSPGSPTTSRTQLQRYEKNGSWSKVEDITQASPGSQIWPTPIRNAGANNLFRILYMYTERYTGYGGGLWELSLFAYPGANSLSYLSTKGNARTDFGDIRFTTSDGETLQPSASNGKPWIEDKTDSWLARLWVKVGNVPASGDLEVYMYYGKADATNENDQDVMDAQFLFADHFSGDSLDTDKWDVEAGDIGISSSELVLTGTSGTRGHIMSKTAMPVGAAFRSKLRQTGSPVDRLDWTHVVSLGDTAAIQDWIGYYVGPTNPNRMTGRAGKAGSYNAAVDFDSSDLSDGLIIESTWQTDKIQWIDVTANSLKLTETNTDYIPTEDLKFYLREGSVVGAYGHIDWVFARPLTDPEPTLRAFGAEEEEEVCSPSIELNTSSWSVNGGSPVSEDSTYNTGLTWCTITNNSGGPVNISISGIDMTGGGHTWTLSDTATPGDMTYGLKAGLSGEDYTIIVKKNSPYNSLVEDLADEATQDWGLKIYTPTVFDDGNEKSGTITLTVVCS